VALLAVAVLVFVGFGLGGGDPETEQPPPLDPAAQRACDRFQPIADDVRTGRLTGPPLFRALQDVFNEARLSQDGRFSAQVRDLYSAAINDDEQTVSQQVSALEEVCAAGR
jgi:hypothetical protein